MEMEQYINAYVRYISTPKQGISLQTGRIYAVDYINSRSNSLGIRVGKNRFVSSHFSNFEIIDTDNIPLTVTDIKIHSVLLLKGSPAGIRFTSSNIPYFDMELGSFNNLAEATLNQHPQEILNEYGSYFMTEEEYNSNITILNLSGNKQYIDFISKNLLNIEP